MSITVQNFGEHLTAALKTVGSYRQKVQQLIVFANEVYEQNGDSGLFTRIVRAVETQKIAGHAQVKSYVIAHTDLAWAKLSDGTTGFKKSKQPNKTAIAMTVNWWEFDKPKKAPKTQWDINTRMSVILESLKDPAKQVRVNMALLRSQIADINKMLAPAPESMDKAA